MADKEKNFISAVVYLGDEAGCAEPFLEMLTGRLGALFQNFELVFVNDASRDGTEGEVRAFLKKLGRPLPVTMIHLSLKQGLELAMNAGLDMAVGDFVFEFDSMRAAYPPEYIEQAYTTCLAGNDIVSVSPSRNRALGSSLFYKLFNATSRSPYKLRTDVFRILSRRAINRVHGINPSLPYRKASYAASGLKMATLEFEGDAGQVSEHLRFSRAVNSLALYTGTGSRISMVIAGVMLALMLAAVVYTLAVFLGGAVEPAEGWTTTMLLLTGGFFGVFLILAIVLKYLSLLVDLVFRKQSYLIESVEKLA